MDKVKYIKLEKEDGSFGDPIPLSVDGNYIDINGTNLTQVINNKANQSDLNVQKTRIDNLTQLEEGSTTGDAELIDIRAGFDGTNYSSAGIAVRNQIENLNNKNIILEEEKLDIKIKDYEYVYHTYININGKIYTSQEGDQFYDTFKSTDYIETKGWKYLYLKNTFHYGGDGLGFYDKDKVGIIGAGYNTKVGEDNKYVLLEIPDEAVYFRSSSFTNEETEFYFAKTISSLRDTINNYSVYVDNVKINELRTIKTTKNFNRGQPQTTFIYDIENDSISITPKTIAGNDFWVALDNAFIPFNWNTSFVIELDIDTLSNAEEFGIYLADGIVSYQSGRAVELKKFKTTGHIKLTVDPSYYTVYYDPAWTSFQVWLTVHRHQQEIDNTTVLSNIKIYNVDEKWENLQGNTSEDFFRGIDNYMSKTNLAIEEITNKPIDIKLIAPNSNKYELNVNNDGTIIGAKIIPDSSMFIGNSLLRGSGYGMAASDEYHDYYYLINSYITSLNNSYSPSKMSGTDFEGLTNSANITSTVAAITNQLSGNEDLIVIQLGDNVNTEAKIAIFPESSIALCKAIREKCPKARVVWMGMWYGSTVKYEAIQNACSATGCHYINFIGLTGSDANSAIGNIQKKTLATRTLNNVSNVTEDGNSIVVTFTVSDKSYTSTIPVNSYSLNGTTLSYTSEYDVIISGGVASHPGDEGFRRIANRFLYEMGLTTEEEYYPK